MNQVDDHMNTLYPSLDVINNISQFAEAIGSHEVLIETNLDVLVPIEDIPVNRVQPNLTDPIVPFIHADKGPETSGSDTPRVATDETEGPLLEDFRFILKKYPTWRIDEKEPGVFQIVQKNAVSYCVGDPSENKGCKVVVNNDIGCND